METYSLEEVRKHNSEDSAWLVYNGRVFDVTEFVSHHPGGRNVLLPKLGKDVSEIMQDSSIHKHSDVAYNMMNKYRIGRLSSSQVIKYGNTQYFIFIIIYFEFFVLSLYKYNII